MSSFARETRTQLINDARNALNARVTGADSRLRRSLLSATAVMWGGGFDGLYGALAYVADQIIPDSADADHLARWASFWGVFPKTATAAAGSALSATGCTDGTPLPAGTILQRADEATYIVTADAEAAGGTVDVQIQAQATGSASSCEAGVILNLVSPIAGIVGPFTVVAEMDGSNPETNPELLARLEARVQTPPTGGGPGDYVKWAESQPGVTRAWDYPWRMGLGTVGVTWVYDERDDILPLAGDVTAMQAYLDSVAPVTALVYAFACTANVQNFAIAITPNNADTQAAVTAQLASLFAQNEIPEQGILKADFDDAVGEAAGVTDYAVTSPAADIAGGAGQLLVLGAIAFSLGGGG
jgi:uncharacterized phage protein gp47/JayE